MAKNHRPPTRAEKERRRETDRFFINSNDEKVPLRAISMFNVMEVENGIREIFKEEGIDLEPPTYKVPIAGGDFEEVPLNENVLQVEGDPEETQRRVDAWVKHRAIMQNFELAVRDASMLQFMDAVEIDEIPNEEEWVAKMRKRGILVPKDPDERRMKYLMHRYIITPDDLIEFQQKVVNLASGGLAEEEVRAKSESFRDQIYTIAKEQAQATLARESEGSPEVETE